MMRQVIYLARWEWFRQSRKISVIVLHLLALLLAAVVLGVAAMNNVGWIPFPAELSYFQTAARFLATVTPLLAILLAALVHAVDLQGGNCRTLAARGASRISILASKALMSFVVLLVFHLIVLSLALLLALTISPHFEEWRAGLAGVGVSLLNSLLYLALGIALAHWRQSTAFTVGVGIAVIFFEAIAYPIAGVIGQSINWPINEITAWTLWGVSNGLEGGSDLLGAGWFIPIVGGYAAALVGLAILIFQRFDLRAGGD